MYPATTILPSLPLHVDGLVGVILDGVGGVDCTVISTVLTGDVQPATVWDTLIINVPIPVGLRVIVLVVLDPRPAIGEDEVQLNVAPGLGLTETVIISPRHAGFGFAIILEGAGGDPGSDRLTGPAKTPDVHPIEFVTEKLV